MRRMKLRYEGTQIKWRSCRGKITLSSAGLFQCRGVLLIWILVGQEPKIVLAVGAGGVLLDTFFLSSVFSISLLPLCETARYKLKYCLKGPLNSKQPTAGVAACYKSALFVK